MPTSICTSSIPTASRSSSAIRPAIRRRHRRRCPIPTAAANAPLLDGDSNGGCVIDGRDQENVVWSMAPASGHYIVRVDAASLCELAYSDWRVDERRRRQHRRHRPRAGHDE